MYIDAFFLSNLVPQAVRIEITSQHSHELAAERGRAGDLEEQVVGEKSKYHQLADELRRSEEMVKMEQHAMREERDKTSKLSMQLSTLIRLRDELREQISELQVQLSTTERSAQSTSGTLESKEVEYTHLRKELDELKRVYKKKQQEDQDKKDELFKQETKHVSTKKEATVAPLPGSPSTASALPAPPSTMMKQQLKATLTECSQLRTEVTTLRMAMHEKDFRLQALREIVGGLERMQGL